MKRKSKFRLSVLLLLALFAAAAFFRGVGPRPGAARSADPLYEAYRNRTTVALNGKFRDFMPRIGHNGHPDFGLSAPDGGGRYANMVADRLGPDGVPVFRSSGYKVSRQWRDAQGRPIASPRPYLAARPGDQPGLMSPTEGGAITGPATLDQWFRDVPGVATATSGQLTVMRPGYPGVFEFHGYLDAATPTGSLQDDGNASTTYAAETLFIYERGTGQSIEVETDASVWVFVDDRLVIDGGGAASLPWTFSGITVNGPINLRESSQILRDPNCEDPVATNSTAPGAIRLVNSSRIHSDVKIGPGGDPAVVVQGPGRIIGTVTTLFEPLAIPTVRFPMTAQASRGDLTYNGRVMTFDESFRCRNLRIDGNSVVTVSGNLTILCEGDLIIRNNTTINLAPGSTLDMYVAGQIVMDNSVQVNVNTRDPSLVTIFATTDQPINMPNTVDIYANFVAPNAMMTYGQGVRVFGSFYGAALQGRNTGIFTMFDSSAGGRAGTQIRMGQRIDLDRCEWLRDGRTYSLKLFFADRNPPKSTLSLRTNIDTLNLAAPFPGRDQLD